MCDDQPLSDGSQRDSMLKVDAAQHRQTGISRHKKEGKSEKKWKRERKKRESESL